MNLRKISSKTLSKKIFALIATFAIMGQGIFAPFVGMPRVHAAPGELPQTENISENISASASISGNMAETLSENNETKNLENSENLTLNSASEEKNSENISNTSSETPQTTDISEGAAATVGGSMADSEGKLGTSSAIDLSSGENIQKSLVNVAKNTAESLQDTMTEAVDAVTTAANTVTRTVRGVTRFRSAGTTSTSGVTDLLVKIDSQTQAENNRHLSYRIVVTNQGPSVANGSLLQVALPAGMRQIALECSSATNGAVCPARREFEDGNTNVSQIIENLPVNGVVNFDLRAKFPLRVPTSVNITANVSVPTGMTEMNDRSNTSVMNTNVIEGSADVAVTQFSSSIANDMNPRVQAWSGEGDVAQEIVFDNPKPIMMTTRYTNNGPGYADGSGIGFAINLGDRAYNFSKKLEYENLSIICRAHGGAVCPENFNYNSGRKHATNGWMQTETSESHIVAYHASYTKIPDFPENGYIDVTVTFTPKKISLINNYPSSQCSDIESTTAIGFNGTSIEVPSGISDRVMNNNVYTKDNITTISTANTPVLDLPKLMRECPKVDLAVTSIGQNVAGIVTTRSESNGFGQDLVLPQPKPLEFNVTYQNKGNTEVSDARFNMSLYLNDQVDMHYTNLRFECSTTGGAECPLAYRKSEDIAYPAEGILKTTTYGRIYLFSGNEIIPKMPAGSTVTIKLKFDLTKLTTNYYSSCGNGSRNINLSWGGASISHADRSLVEVNSRDNNLGRDDLEAIKNSDISIIQFGKETQKSCPQTDLAVTQISQSFVGALEYDEILSENKFFTYPRIKNAQPISFTVKYENKGADDADGASINLRINNRNTYYSTPRYKNLKYFCETTGGAECPVEMVNYNENHNTEKTGYVNGSFISHSVPKFPAGSSVTIRVEFVPDYVYASYSSCGDDSVEQYIYIENVGIRAPSGVAEPNTANNHYGGFNPSSETSLQRIQVGELGNIVYGLVRQKNDICKRSGVTIEVVDNSEKPLYQLIDGKEFEYDVIYRNNSDVDVENVQTYAHKRDGASGSYWSGSNSAIIPYSKYSVTCEAKDGAVCPESQPTGTDIPYNGQIADVAGEWQTTADNIYKNFYNITIPSLPARSELRMKVRYTLHKPKNIVINNEGYNYVSMQNLWVHATLPSSIYTSNQGNLTHSLNTNYIYLNDVYINNKFVERNPGDGECTNPSLMTQNGIAETNPGKSICSYVEIGNAGMADAHGFNFRSTVPNGLENIDVSTIKCVVTAGESEGTKCGQDFYFDTETRVLSGKIDTITNGGKVVLMLSGRAVDYASSWKSVNTITPPTGWYERIESTNRSEQSFSIRGTDPAITKASSVRVATMGDEFDYIISVRNPEGGESLKNVKITDLIPDSFYYKGTKDVILTGGAAAENPSVSRDSLVENISGTNERVDENIDAWKRPIKNTDRHLEWGTFSLPVGGSVTVSFKVKVKESYSCQDIVHNSAYLHYSQQNDVASTRVYNGNLVGFETDDVELVGCKEITANTDIINTTHVLRGGKAILTPETYNIIANDTVYAPALTSVAARDISIKVESIRNLNKEILFAGASDGISSKGIHQMTGGFKYGNRLQGKGGVDPIDTNAGINVFDYKELPDLAIGEDGSITWKKNLPMGKYLGAYTICDKVNTLSCSTAPIIVVVPDSENHPPVAVADTEKTLVNNPIEIDVLKNDSDPDDDAITITNVENSQNGQFIIENRKIKFTPKFDFVGEATAEYTISDGRNGTAKARITVLVEKNINLPPVAVNDSAMIDMNTDILLNVLENDSDPERDAITLESVNVINNSGTAEVRDGKMYFKPKQDFVGVAVVTYTIKDTSENRANGVAVITVINNTAPTAVDDVENILKNEKITLAVLENDTDPEDDRLIIERIENPQNGTFNIVGNKVEFTPTPDFVGEARAVYHIFDGTNGRASANIIITVSEAIPPVAVDDTAETEFNTAKEIDVLANDSDPKKNTLTIISVENEENGKFEIISNKIKFTPNQDFHGTATARYTISNGKNGTASANITVTVKEAPLPPPPANNPPVANNDEVETGKNAPVLINVLANDSDADRDTLTITSISNQENGTFVKEDDKVRFTPTPDFVGNAKAIYTIDDGKGGVAYATIVVVVKPEPTFTATESLEKTGPFVKQCGPKQNTTPVNFTHKITETYVSKISRADAEEKVRAKLAERMEAEFNVKGQQHAEENGVCNDNPPDTFTANETLERTGEFSKVCGPKQHTTPVRFTHRIADSYTSNISLEDAKEKLAKILRDRMDAEFNEKGQTYANENGVCINNAPDVFTATESLERAKDFSKQCAPNQHTTPVNFVHKITLTETSNISLVDAQNKVRAKLEEKMNAEFDRLGQANAEQNGVCNDNTYSATENLSKTGKFFKNNCAVDTFANGVDFTHTITETVTSNISEEDARTKVRAKLVDRMNAEFERLGQDHANAHDTCTDVPTFTATDSLTHSGKFTRNNCSEEETTEAVAFTHTVTDTYVSKISQEDANMRLKLKLLQKMNEEFAIKGQIFANENGVCTPKPKFTATKSLEKTGDFTPQCDEGFAGKPVSYTHKIEETYISKISQEDAEMHAERILNRRMAEEFETAGQTHANENGECLPIQETTDTLTKTANFSKVCKAGQISKPVSFTHTITVTKSSVSLEEAKKLVAEELQAKMDAEFDKLGNKYAEENGKCDYPTSSSSSSSSSTTKTIIIGCADKNAVNYNSSVTQHDEKSCKYEGEPLFSAPVIGGQCISAVKNLDDPKLIAYYDDLKIVNRDNVHRQISRVEFIKLVLNAGKVDLEKFSDTTGIADFSDIDLESWYAPYVSYMVATATMSGQEITDEDGNITKIFRPNDTISRAEASKILSELVRKTGQALPTIEEITSFTDVEPSASLSPYIQFAYNSCLLHGRNTIDGQPIDGKPRVFEPADSITLAETAKVLYNITHSNVNNDEKFKEIISNVEKFFAEKVEKNTENTESSDKKNNTTEEKTENTQTISTPITPMLKPTLQVGGQTFDLSATLKP